MQLGLLLGLHTVFYAVPRIWFSQIALETTVQLPHLIGLHGMFYAVLCIWFSQTYLETTAQLIRMLSSSFRICGVSKQLQN